MMLTRVGLLFGGAFLNILSDKFGRRRVFLVACFTYSAVAIAQAFAPDVTSFCVLSFFDGLCEAVRARH